MLMVSESDKYQCNMNMSKRILLKVKEVQEKLNQKKIKRKYSDMS